MTEAEFRALFTDCAEEVASRFYPKGIHPRRMDFLRDMGMLHAQLAREMKERHVFSEQERPVSQGASEHDGP